MKQERRFIQTGRGSIFFSISLEGMDQTRGGGSQILRFSLSITDAVAEL